MIQNVLHVPGTTPLPWEIATVPHGTIHHRFFKAGVIGDQYGYYVYIPPGYNAKAKTRCPALYPRCSLRSKRII